MKIFHFNKREFLLYCKKLAARFANLKAPSLQFGQSDEANDFQQFKLVLVD
jgi:hypothetical protein